MVEAVVNLIVDVIFIGTGRLLARPFGWKPSESAAFCSGMAFWILFGVLLYRLMPW